MVDEGDLGSRSEAPNKLDSMLPWILLEQQEVSKLAAVLHAKEEERERDGMDGELRW